MKNTFKKPAARVLSVVLSVALLLSATVFALPASAANPVYYSGAQTVTMNSIQQTYRYMTFSPTDALVLPYQASAGWQSSVDETIAAAQADGYTVYGGINGEFFSMASGNAGTLTGRLISDGRIISDGKLDSTLSGFYDNCLVLNSDGSFQFAASEMNYHLFVDGKDQGDIIHRINKRYNGNWGYDPLCYFDSACGSKADTVSSYPGVEVVFNKMDNTELTVDGILQGEVVSVGTNTYGTSFSENQFVLYANKNSAYASLLSGLTAGQRVQIYAQVADPSVKDVFKNAYGVTSASYPIVKNGQCVVGEITKDADNLIGQRAQRTAIGIKADGSYVMLTGEGRQTTSSTNSGFTLWELAQLFIDMGCTTAVALDGGGSTHMTYDGTVVDDNGREVGSSMLVVARRTMNGTAQWQRLNDLTYNAKTSTYPDAQQEIVNAAITEAEAVLADTTSAQIADYQREYQDLQLAMGLVTNVKPNPYISLNANTWSTAATSTATNDSSGALILENTDGKWPYTTTSVEMSVPLEYVFEYDITVAGSSSFLLNGNDQTKLNMVFTSSVDSGSGDLGAGTYKGSISVSDMIDKIVEMSQFSQSKGLIASAVTRADLINADGEFSISSLGICSVGAAGAGSRVTVRTLTFRSPYSGGDINGDGSVNSTDARYVLRYLVGSKTLNDAQISSADVNGDGTVSTADAVYMLQKRVGLI